MSVAESIRRKPKKKDRDRILEEQQYKCFYCFVPFDVFNKHVWDHVEPWAYSQHNGASNFVAACAPCNSSKSDRIFTNLDEARLYLAERRKAHSERS